MADERDLEIAQQLNEVLQKSTELAAKRAAEEGKSLSRREKELDLLSRREQLIRQANDLLDVKYDNLEKVQKSLERELERERLKGQIDEENFRQRREFIRIIAEARKKDATQAQAEIEKIIEALKKQNEQQKKNAQAFEAGQEAAAGLVAKLGQAAGLGGQVGQTFKKLVSSIEGSAGLKNAALGLGKGLASSAREMLSLSSIGGMVVENTFEQALQFDELRARMSALTGGNRDLAQQAFETSEALGDQFLRFDQLAEATLTLTRDFSKFSSLQASVQNRIAGTTAGLAKLGVAEGQTSDALNTLVAGLGFTAEEADTKLRELSETASGLSLGPDQLISSLIALKAPLADFGKRGPDVLGLVAKEGKRLGLDVSDLGQKMFSLSDSVDTFSEAADVAAGLGTVLGSTTLDVTQLTMAAAKGPQEVLKLLQQEFINAGRTFSDLEFFERKALASTIKKSTYNL